MSDLGEKLTAVSRIPILLVACDFDGTLAPFADEPSLAEIHRPALQALARLAGLRQTFVSVISGRARRDLRHRVQWPEDIRLVGSFGAELKTDLTTDLIARLGPDAVALREKLARELHTVAASSKNFHVEEKPASVAFHYRRAQIEESEQALRALRERVASVPGLFVTEGRRVMEFSVLPAQKGLALNSVRHETGAAGVVFIGDDITDEDAFASLSDTDLGIKVGEGSSQAAFRVNHPEAVGEILEQLADRRDAWLSSDRFRSIHNHSILSDQRTAALVDPEGRIVWMCLPRIDSNAIFAELLGGPAYGYFDIRPLKNEGSATQQYVDDSLVLQTQWPEMTVTDYLDCSEGRPFQRAGRTDLVRIIEGAGQASIRFAPRLDFGRMPTRLKLHEFGVEVEGTQDPIVLFTPRVPWRLIEEGPHQVALAEVELSDGPIVLDLRYGTGSLRALQNSESIRRKQTEDHWRVWVHSLSLPELGREKVKQSCLVLRALCYRPTGSIAAAATMGLPECPGGVRNWDYRYCWPRDAALACRSLVRLGSTGQGLRFLDWLMVVLENCDSPEKLRPVYTVSGNNLGPESTLSELRGYLHSRPVRVGNMAASQIQLDIFGTITDLIAALAQCDAAITPEHWRLTKAMVSAVEQRWREPDHGIWEIRRHPKHHVYSKVMCWQTVDRAQLIAELYLGRRLPEWDQLTTSIAEDVLAHGYKPQIGAFTSSYEEDGIDAAALHVGLSGMLSPSDERFISTIGVVERELLRSGVVYRYRFDDGLPGIEGGFHLCTSWLIEAYVLVGRLQDARSLFDSMTSCTGNTGMMSEEWDPRWRLSLGNVPQAYSHLGLINAAMMLDAFEHEASETPRA
ncbi:MAG: trehalose-phosphatase [Planctomycetes bacterium]|nr:trehalose-phosphatase [Planctomycetota bacterium]MBI3835336.1 trehalose-phosphatase [Planctomycetota bacterium]